MNKQIEIHYPKTFTLNNVIHVRPLDTTAQSCLEAATGLNRHIRNSGAVPIGPLIQLLQETTDSLPHSAGGGKFLRQARGLVDSADFRFAIVPRISHSGCIMAKFTGDPVDLSIVFSKIAVFAYEHDLQLAGAIYIVFIAEESFSLTADVFAITTREN